MKQIMDGDNCVQRVNGIVILQIVLSSLIQSTVI